MGSAEFTASCVIPPRVGPSVLTGWSPFATLPFPVVLFIVTVFFIVVVLFIVTDGELGSPGHPA